MDISKHSERSEYREFAFSEKLYNYETLDPRETPEAVAHNKAIFQDQIVYGVEVTLPNLAGRCIYNLDPQHTGGDSRLAAIQAALDAPLPPDASVLVTVRPDLDSVGAMAVLGLRSRDIVLNEEAVSRIQLIAASDTFAHGPWPGPKPLPTLETLKETAANSVEDNAELAAIARCVADAQTSLSERVNAAARWIIMGEEPSGYREAWLAEQQDIIEALADGRIKVETKAAGKIAVVTSSHRAALKIGYSQAPVVVACNPEFRFQGSEPHAKFTVSQYNPGYVDLNKVLEELESRESGWGGSATIIGSPQGEASQLTTTSVVLATQRYLLREGSLAKLYEEPREVLPDNETLKELLQADAELDSLRQQEETIARKVAHHALKLIKNGQACHVPSPWSPDRVHFEDLIVGEAQEVSRFRVEIDPQDWPYGAPQLYVDGNEIDYHKIFEWGPEDENDFKNTGLPNVRIITLDQEVALALAGMLGGFD